MLNLKLNLKNTGIDQKAIMKYKEKVELDAEYLRRRSFMFDLYILWLTALKVVRRDGVSH